MQNDITINDEKQLTYIVLDYIFHRT